MSCRILPLFAIALLPLVGTVHADDAPSTATDPGAAASPAADAAASTAAVAPVTDSAATPVPVLDVETGKLLNFQEAPLPTAQEPGFWQKYPPPKIQAKDLKPKIAWEKFKPKRGYIGIGTMNDMLNINAELLTDNGYFYSRIGRFMDAGNVGMNGGWRTAVTVDADGDGYYAGVFAGALIGDSMNNRTYPRLGIGADMSYQWTSENTLSVFSVGLGVGKHRTDANDVQFGPKPTMFFSYSLELRVF